MRRVCSYLLHFDSTRNRKYPSVLGENYEKWQRRRDVAAAAYA